MSKENLNSIAVIGLGLRFPGAMTGRHFWNNLSKGVESIRTLKMEEMLNEGVDELVLDPNYVAAAGILDNIDYFDATFFNLTNKEAEIMDPQQRMLLEVSYEALE